MSSLRHVRRVSCEGKVKYLEQYNAVGSIKAQKLGGELTAYHCRFCTRWHIGHQPSPKPKRHQ